MDCRIWNAMKKPSAATGLTAKTKIMLTKSARLMIPDWLIAMATGML
jgi:hypothetical protein